MGAPAPMDFVLFKNKEAQNHMTQYDQVKAYIEDHRADMLAMWKDFVDTPSQARDKAAATNMADKLTGILTEMGMRVTGHDVGPVNSRTIEAIWGEDRPGAPVMFGGHYDTVNCSPVENAKPGDANEFDGTPHFRLDDKGNAYGLGVLDMKGGIVIAIWVVKALSAIGWAQRPIRFLFAGDEDKGHFDANTPELLTELAKGALCCFNMETGRVNNDICIGRKGGGEGEMTVEGVAAHAGNDFVSGRNAVLEMAYKEIALASLTDLDKGTTVTPTVIKGGTVPNGIPDKCHIFFDVRYRKFEEAERVKAAFAEIAAGTHIAGTKTSYIYKEYQVPFDETPDGLALADFVAKVSKRQELGEMGQINLGGGSDACYFTIAGVPTICSMGVCGQFNHSSKEYAIVETLYTRTKLLACAVMDIEEFANR